MITLSDYIGDQQADVRVRRFSGSAGPDSALDSSGPLARQPSRLGPEPGTPDWDLNHMAAMRRLPAPSRAALSDKLRKLRTRECRGTAALMIVSTYPSFCGG